MKTNTLVIKYQFISIIKNENKINKKLYYKLKKQII